MFIFQVDSNSQAVSLGVTEGSEKVSAGDLMMAAGVCVLKAAQMIEEQHPDLKFSSTVRAIADSLNDTAAAADARKGDRLE